MYVILRTLKVCTFIYKLSIITTVSLDVCMQALGTIPVVEMPYTIINPHSQSPDYWETCDNRININIK